jgi:transposase
VAGATLASTEKKCQQEGRTPVFVDEAGFYLLAAVVATYAPIGQTPLLHAPLSRDHLSVISGITPEGKLYSLMQQEAFTSEGCIRFLVHLQNHIPGKILVIWDGSPIHRSKAIRKYLAEGAAARLLLEPLPGYAPELNPDEGIWRYLKFVELKNVCCRNLDHLKQELRRARERLRHKVPIIQACFQQAGCL